MVPWNSIGRCGAMLTSARTEASEQVRTSTPPRRTAPSSGSAKRMMRLSSVVLPSPVPPTTASVCPGRTEKLTSSSTRPSASA